MAKFWSSLTPGCLFQLVLATGEKRQINQVVSSFPPLGPNLEERLAYVIYKYAMNFEDSSTLIRGVFTRQMFEQFMRRKGL